MSHDEELAGIITKFAELDLLDWLATPSRAWLDAANRKDATEALIAAIAEADAGCGSCGCELDPLYKRALTLLRA